MTLKIKVSNFEGPFDLLLHLIRKNEMDIYNIKIYEVTNQYLEYLDTMKEMDLEVTSEFIVVAATLLEIKSRTLLPKEKPSDEESLDEDPRKTLVAKLIEYKKFKQAAEFLRQRKDEAGIIFTKKPELIEDKPDGLNNEDLFKGLTMLDLYNLFSQLMNRYMSKQNTENTIQTRIPVDKYRIEDKIDELKLRFHTGRIVNFLDVVHECASKIEVVVTFLALLELIKLRTVRVLQEKNFKEIYVERIAEDEEEGDNANGD